LLVETPIENWLFEYTIFLKRLFLLFSDNFLLSLNFKGLLSSSFFSRITAAATTGPAIDPLPTSSTPTIFLNPEFNISSSTKECGKVLVIEVNFSIFLFRRILLSLFLFLYLVKLLHIQ
tara:strand:+ start:606 stop:962 length:357 start_codon:yes stop_codon:yes gene_type:complete